MGATESGFTATDYSSRRDDIRLGYGSGSKAYCYFHEWR